MRAAVVDRYGPPDVVRIAEVERPSPRPDEVLLRVRASTVNRTDCGVRSGKPFIARLFYGMARPRASILGNEFAGEVVEIGDAVTAFRVGDKVFGFSAGLGAHGDFGAHAEFMAVPADGSLAEMPAGLTYEQAAPCTEGSTYAQGLISAARVQSGQRVLVYGASGAIGSAAVQLLKSLDVSVTAVCGTANLELARSLGADKVVDYLVQDFTKDDQLYDAVLDAVGKTTFGRCRRLLRSGGIYASADAGPGFQNVFLALVTPLLRGRRVSMHVPRRSQAFVRHLKDLIEAGQLRPVVDRRYPLDQIADAYRYVDTGMKVGSVVISVDASN